MRRRWRNVLVGVIAQHASSPPAGGSVLGQLNLFTSAAPFDLSFHIGKTVIVYGYLLATLIALAIVLLARAVLNAYADRNLLPCPHCLTPCPIEATVCRSCSLEMVEAEPESS
ncbi:MAG TPA: hypothetical protein VLJ76_09045 [Gaiellaceae bacterium]|nr:hypothetical protein [Gaiellaceae bacterium]